MFVYDYFINLHEIIKNLPYYIRFYLQTQLLHLQPFKNTLKMNINKNVSISENGFIFNPTTGESFTVNPIGVEIINLLKDQKNEANIKKTLLEKYNTDSSTIEKDYYDFIQMLKSSNLIENIKEEDTQKNND